jgi:hypothetical protein
MALLIQVNASAMISLDQTHDAGKRFLPRQEY